MTIHAWEGFAWARRMTDDIRAATAIHAHTACSTSKVVTVRSCITVLLA
jgi:hypothetical protein